MHTDHPGFQALVLAGERPGGSEFSRQLGLKSSVLVDVAGKSAVERVISSLAASVSVSGGLLVGPSRAVFDGNPEFAQIIDGSGFHWIPQANGPSDSVLSGLDQLEHYPVLLTAADHALLTPGIIDAFCRAAAFREEDLVVGLVPYDRVAAAFPESKRTVLKFSDGRYCGSNLFAVLNPDAKAGPRFWRTLESDRKRPWRMVRRLGLLSLLRYLTRSASLLDAARTLSGAMGCRVGFELIDEPRAAIDVDSLADLELAEKILRDQQ